MDRLIRLERRLSDESQLYVIVTDENVTPEKTFRPLIITPRYFNEDMLTEISKMSPDGANAFEVGYQINIYEKITVHPIAYYTISEHTYKRALKK